MWFSWNQKVVDMISRHRNKQIWRFSYSELDCAIITYVTTIMSRIVLEKLVVSQLVKKFTTFYVTRRLITVFTRTRHWPYRGAKEFSPKPYTLFSLIYILILSFHFHLCLSSDPSYSRLLTLNKFFIPLSCCTPNHCNFTWSGHRIIIYPLLFILLNVLDTIISAAIFI
jgi:hypothetical protein